MLEGTLRTHIPGCWIARVATEGTKVRIMDRKVARDGSMESLVEISKPAEGAIDDILDGIRKTPTVVRVRAVSSDEGRLLGIVHCAHCRSCQALATSDCFVTNTVCRDGSIEWTLRFEDKAKLAQLIEQLRQRKTLVEITRIVPVRGTSILTPRQAQVLDKALEIGYFEYPKRSGVAALAKHLGVSKSTVSETLRRAEAKALRSYVDSHS